MNKKRKNSKDVIDRANKKRADKMSEDGFVYATPKLKCRPEHRDEIRNSGLEAMHKTKSKLDPT